jgi:hypothetical protein
MSAHPRLREKPLSCRRRFSIAHKHILLTPQGPQSKTRRSSFAMWAILMANRHMVIRNSLSTRDILALPRAGLPSCYPIQLAGPKDFVLASRPRARVFRVS